MNFLIKTLLFCCAFSLFTYEKNYAVDFNTNEEITLHDDYQNEQSKTEEDENSSKKDYSMYKKIAYCLAAATLLVCGVGIYWYIQHSNESIQNQNNVNFEYRPIPLNEDGNFQATIRCAGYPNEQTRVAAESVFVEQMQAHEDFPRAIEHMLRRYPIDPANPIHITYQNRRGICGGDTLCRNWVQSLIDQQNLYPNLG